MNKLSNITKTELHDQLTFNLEVELEQLFYFDVLFKAIRTDIANNGHSAKALANLGEYLAQDFIHYLESELDDLNKAKGSDDEKQNIFNSSCPNYAVINLFITAIAN